MLRLRRHGYGENRAGSRGRRNVCAYFHGGVANSRVKKVDKGARCAEGRWAARPSAPAETGGRVRNRDPGRPGCWPVWSPGPPRSTRHRRPPSRRRPARPRTPARCRRGRVTPASRTGSTGWRSTTTGGTRTGWGCTRTEAVSFQPSAISSGEQKPRRWLGFLLTAGRWGLATGNLLHLSPDATPGHCPAY